MSKELEKVKVLEVKEVAFNGSKILVVKHDEELYSPINGFCKELNINSDSQLKRIKGDELLNEGSVKLTVPTAGGPQQMFCLKVDLLPLWLSGIKISMCKEEVRSFRLSIAEKIGKLQELYDLVSYLFKVEKKLG